MRTPAGVVITPPSTAEQIPAGSVCVQSEVAKTNYRAFIPNTS